MIVKTISLTTLRGFLSAFLEISPTINLFVGKNNSGKSTILKSVYSLQNQILNDEDVSIGYDSARIFIQLEHYSRKIEVDEVILMGNAINRGIPLYSSTAKKGALFKNQDFYIKKDEIYILPFWSGRKVEKYNQQIGYESVNSFTGKLDNIIPKIDSINNDSHPNFELFKESCEKILGFRVTTIPVPRGKTLGFQVYYGAYIAIEAMGDGVPNLLGLIYEICMAERKIVLIEEPENDIHPGALKELMNLIIKKSETNQFFISSHSSVVLKQLGASESAKVFAIRSEIQTNEFDLREVVATIQEVSTSDERIELLKELGYDVFDSFFYKYWILLEESSAETIIRYLIDWFVPGLRHKVKTFSCRGFTNVKSKYNSLKDLFVFLHMHELYENAIWVILDAGEKESQVIEEFHKCFMNKVYSNRFSQFSKHDFEEYYPPVFDADFQEIRNCKDDKSRLKKELLLKVIDWINSNSELARSEFEKSASEVINKLKEIESELLKQ
ncbi:AAA family ATPase [Emticicia sp. ODNR4P]|nr:AAA family ATPase [Emticicia sp. ODNR4P]